MSTAQNFYVTQSRAAAYLRPIVEWGFWVALAAIYYSQTRFFDETIPNYAFGATGWPRALALAVALGATGQLLVRLSAIRRSGATASAATEEISVGARLYRVLLFVFPFIYLYFAPIMGFYLTTPFFILGLLLLLEVRSPLTLVSVTAVVYGLVLAVFTRFFFVALPTGTTSPFYDINVAIIEFARIGV